MHLEAYLLGLYGDRAIADPDGAVSERLASYGWLDASGQEQLIERFAP
ncbi:MAG: hypothetical protein JWQ49_5994 [Edaphobacter sp.]|nr:hypothetical protein [Edaphobacter sp.]